MRVLLILALAFATGCELAPLTDGDDGGTGTGLTSDGGAGTGTLSGAQAFTVDGAFELHYLDNSTGAYLGFGADLVDYTDTCADLQDLDGGTVPGPYSDVRVSVLAGEDNSGPTAGTYQVVTQVTTGEGLVAVVTSAQVLAGGSASTPLVAQSGTVTLTTSDDGELAGTFDVFIPDSTGVQSELSGTFDAPYCP